MGDAEIYERLTEIFRELFGDDGLVLRPEMTARDVEGWDSMRMVLIAVAVEERFGITLRTRDLDGLASVGDFVSLIAAKTNAVAS